MCRMAVIRDKMHLWVFYHFHWPFTILSFSRSEICSDFKLKFSSSSKNADGSIDWFDDLVQFLKQELKNLLLFSGFVAVVDWSGWVESSRSAILVQWSARCPHGRWLWVHSHLPQVLKTRTCSWCSAPRTIFFLLGETNLSCDSPCIMSI